MPAGAAKLQPGYALPSVFWAKGRTKGKAPNVKDLYGGA